MAVPGSVRELYFDDLARCHGNVLLPCTDGLLSQRSDVSYELEVLVMTAIIATTTPLIRAPVIIHRSIANRVVTSIKVKVDGG